MTDSKNVHIAEVFFKNIHLAKFKDHLKVKVKRCGKLHPQNYWSTMSWSSHKISPRISQLWTSTVIVPLGVYPMVESQRITGFNVPFFDCKIPSQVTQFSKYLPLQNFPSFLVVILKGSRFTINLKKRPSKKIPFRTPKYHTIICWWQK